MTREELKENICGMTHDDMFEYIYKLESRTCDNCKYSKQHERDFSLYGIYYCMSEDVPDADGGLLKVTKDFGCNKWETNGS
jgi:hypothetical protein